MAVYHIPIIGVRVLSLLAITALLRSLEIHEVQWILVAGAASALLLCFVPLSVLLVLVERPLEEFIGYDWASSSRGPVGTDWVCEARRRHWITGETVQRDGGGWSGTGQKSRNGTPGKCRAQNTWLR